VINNIEFDHADIYADLDAVLRRSGGSSISSAQRAAAARRRQPACRGLAQSAVSPVETFGTGARRGLAGSDIEHADGLTRFKVRHTGDVIGQFASPLLGVHNVRNALAALRPDTTSAFARGDLAEGLRASKASSAGSKPWGRLPV
jgi:UDP-N-acetylmuramate: L-alanyl-gamma-D-glutamyl-meso-diaminopimelate ligase